MRLHVSVADSHVGAVVRAVADQGGVAIIRSEPDDISAVTDSVSTTIVKI